MLDLITCILPVDHQTELGKTLKTLRSTGVIAQIILVGEVQFMVDGFDILKMAGSNILSTVFLQDVSPKIKTQFTLFYTKTLPLDLAQNSLFRMMQVSQSSGAGIVYSDYFEQKNGVVKPHPVIEYQDGSLRDDFDFGSLMLFSYRCLGFCGWKNERAI